MRGDGRVAAYRARFFAPPVSTISSLPIVALQIEDPPYEPPMNAVGRLPRESKLTPARDTPYQLGTAMQLSRTRACIRHDSTSDTTHLYSSWLNSYYLHLPLVLRANTTVHATAPARQAVCNWRESQRISRLDSVARVLWTTTRGRCCTTTNMQPRICRQAPARSLLYVYGTT